MEKAKGHDYIKNWVAVIGDSTFMHTGINSLINMFYNQSHGTVIILDNRTTGMTGHQDHPATGKTLSGEIVPAVDFVKLCNGIGITNVHEVNPYDIDEMTRVIKEEVNKDELSVIISKAPCALLKDQKHPYKVEPVPEKCVHCGACLRPGCRSEAGQGLTGGDTMETKNIMIVGVGGQGTLLTSRILGGVMENAGYEVKVSEVHGMAQRGGSVVTFVRYGDKVAEPIVEEGQADVLIAFERLEAMRYAHFLKPDGVLIANDWRIDPISVVMGAAKYPDNIIENLEKEYTVYRIDAMAEALRLGNSRVFNNVVLGMAARHMDFTREEWLKVIEEKVPPKTVEINTKAFLAGYEK